MEYTLLFNREDDSVCLLAYNRMLGEMHRKHFASLDAATAYLKETGIPLKKCNHRTEV